MKAQKKIVKKLCEALANRTRTLMAHKENAIYIPYFPSLATMSSWHSVPSVTIRANSAENSLTASEGFAWGIVRPLFLIRFRDPPRHSNPRNPQGRIGIRFLYNLGPGLTGSHLSSSSESAEAAPDRRRDGPLKIAVPGRPGGHVWPGPGMPVCSGRRVTCKLDLG
jgi:hypothetical protein